MEKKLSRLTTEQRLDLVAYLDGELNESETQRIEKLLAESEVARAEVEVLAATYELLDELPRARASKDFTEKTMATARLEEVRPDISQSPLFRRLYRAVPYLGWTVAMIVAGGLGFAATRFWTPQPHDPLVRELDLIRNLDKYSEVGSVDFLQRLASSEALMQELRGESHAQTSE